MMASTAPGFTEAQARERSAALREPAWLLEDRLAAWKRYASLPAESNPLFTRHVEQPRGLGQAAPDAIRPALRGPTHPGATLTSLDGGIPDGAKDALRNALPGFDDDKLSNLARALHGGGAVLHLARDARLGDEPVRIRYDALPSSGAAFARNVLVLEPGSRATVLIEVAEERPAGPPGMPPRPVERPLQGLLGLTAEAVLGAGAELRLLSVDAAGETHATLLTTQVLAGDDARVEVHHAFTGGSLVKSRTDIVLQGRGSRVQQSEVVFGHGQQRFDLTSNIRHAGPETTSDALAKAALKDSARANIKGVITLQREGKDSDSYLAQHAMLLSKQARCIAIPSLEIVNREIRRAKHAATVAQVDESQIFYLQTRGLSEDEARKEIVMGFLSPLLLRLGDEEGAKLRAEIEARWA